MGAGGLDHLVDAYLEARLVTGELASSSAEVIRTVLYQWGRHVDGIAPCGWTAELVTSWVHQSELRPSSRKSRLTKLAPFARWLIRAGHLDHDPTADLGRIRVPDGDPRDLTADEVALVLSACPDQRAVLIVLLMVHIGLRCGDAARIRVEDIDARRRSLHVRGKGGRGEYTHWDPIPDEAWLALAAWIRSQRLTAGPLLRSYHDPSRGLQPATVSKMVGSWVRAAGIKEFPYDGKSAHAFRHTCAQDMLDGGAELREVQYTLGHRTIRSTELYTRREPPGLRAAVGGRSYRPAA